MSCTFKCQQIRFNRGSLQLVDQPHRLFMRDVLVFCPMNAQGRGGVRRHPIQRASLNMQIVFGVEVAAKPKRQNLMCINALAIGLGEVTGPVNIDHTGHRTRLFRMTTRPFKPGNMRRDRQELSQMPTGRPTGYANAGRIHFIRFGVGSHPAHCGLGIVNSGRKLKFRRQPVRDRYRDISTFGQFYA